MKNNLIKILYDKNIPMYIKIENEIIDKYEALSLAISLRGNNKNNNYRDAIIFMEFIRNVFNYDYTFQNISNIAYRYLIKDSVENNNELSIQEYFNNNINKILGKEYSYIKQPKDFIIKEHLPDSWVKYKEDIFPVEIKKYNFDNKALKQLLRYISVYKSKKGIAVGEKLTITEKLPSNITFISCEGWILF